jgi:hypothetical protein
MALIFSRSDIAHDKATDEMLAGQNWHAQSRPGFLLILIILLLTGTLKVGLLTNPYAQVTLPISGADSFQEFLFRLVPYDAAKGEEGVTAQGALLVHDSFTHRWTWIALGLVESPCHRQKHATHSGAGYPVHR